MNLRLFLLFTAFSAALLAGLVAWALVVLQG